MNKYEIGDKFEVPAFDEVWELKKDDNGLLAFSCWRDGKSLPYYVPSYNEQEFLDAIDIEFFKTN